MRAMRTRAYVALLILAALLGGLAGHHDRYEPAVRGKAGATLVANAATHAGAAAHVEASELERHSACPACLLLRLSGFALAPAIEVAVEPGAPQIHAASAFESPSHRPARHERGRAPPAA
jgi:hypothetical protein